MRVFFNAYAWSGLLFPLVSFLSIAGLVLYGMNVAGAIFVSWFVSLAALFIVGAVLLVAILFASRPKGWVLSFALLLAAFLPHTIFTSLLVNVISGDLERAGLLFAGLVVMLWVGAVNLKHLPELANPLVRFLTFAPGGVATVFGVVVLLNKKVTLKS